MKKIAMLVLVLATMFPAALAEGTPSPGGGPVFGQHISAMAPGHPREHGAAFGACVSAMASGTNCEHH